MYCNLNVGLVDSVLRLERREQLPGVMGFGNARRRLGNFSAIPPACNNRQPSRRPQPTRPPLSPETYDPNSVLQQMLQTPFTPYENLQIFYFQSVEKIAP
jgi:hypothetical protein